MKSFLTIVLLSTTLMYSCSTKQEDTPQPFDSGVVVINEGGFGKGNGSLSFIPRNSSNVLLDIFKTENNKNLGDIVQSYTEAEEKGFVVVNNSNKVEVVNPRTFKTIATLTQNIIQPRYLAVRNGKAYISCWDKLNADYSFKQGFVAVVDLATYQTIKTIPVGKGPEAVAVVGSEVVVANSGDETLSLINSSDAVQTLTVGTAPTELETDANNKLWVLCKGAFGAKSEIIRINPSNKAIEARLPVGLHPNKKAGNLSPSADKKTFFFTYNFYDAADAYKYKGEVYSFGISDTAIPATQPVASKPFYGLGVDPQTNVIYGGFAPSFSQSGYVYRYQPSGKLIDSLKVEVGPNGFFFK